MRKSLIGDLASVGTEGEGKDGICQKYKAKLTPTENPPSPKEVKEHYKEIQRLRLAEVVV